MSQPKPLARGPSVKFISSADNAVYRSLLDCLLAKGIRKHGQFLISGERAVLETLEQWPAMVRNLIVSAPDRDAALTAMYDLPSKLKAAVDQALHLESTVARPIDMPAGTSERLSLLALPPLLFNELDIHGTHKPLLVIRTPEMAKVDLKQITPGLEIFCALGDPSNVGALIRSAAAFGASRVVLLQECASPFHPKATRSASAATLKVPLAMGPSIRDLATSARLADAPWIALDMDGKDIGPFTWPRNARLIIGQEGQGVPKSSHFDYLMIPMQNHVESLNATVASSIALFSWSQRSR